MVVFKEDATSDVMASWVRPHRTRTDRPSGYHYFLPGYFRRDKCGGKFFFFLNNELVIEIFFAAAVVKLVNAT